MSGGVGCLGQRQQLGQRAGLDRGIHQHELREGGDQADRREVLVAVVGQLLVDQRIDGVAHRHDRERVAVARRLGDDLARHHAVGAGAVVGHHRLAPGLREVLADRARQQVGRAARRERDHHADLLVGIRALRAHDRRRGAAPARPAPLRKCARFIAGSIPTACPSPSCARGGGSRLRRSRRARGAWCSGCPTPRCRPGRHWWR